MAKYKLDKLWTKALGDCVKVEYDNRVNRMEVVIPGGSRVGYEIKVVQHKMEMKIVIDFNGREWDQISINNKTRPAVMDLWNQLKDLEFKGREVEHEIRTSAAQQYFEED